MVDETNDYSKSYTKLLDAMNKCTDALLDNKIIITHIDATNLDLDIDGYGNRLSVTYLLYYNNKIYTAEVFTSYSTIIFNYRHMKSINDVLFKSDMQSIIVNECKLLDSHVKIYIDTIKEGRYEINYDYDLNYKLGYDIINKNYISKCKALRLGNIKLYNYISMYFKDYDYLNRVVYNAAVEKIQSWN
jgi:hypothetical protein